MANNVRMGAMAVLLGLGLMVALFMVACLSPVAADANVDLTVEMQAPSHVAGRLCRDLGLETGATRAPLRGADGASARSSCGTRRRRRPA